MGERDGGGFGYSGGKRGEMGMPSPERSLRVAGKADQEQRMVHLLVRRMRDELR